jgi:hypothetical protein
VTLPDAITQVLPPDDRMRVGTITSVAPVIVDVQGTSMPGHCLSSYTPLVGDIVSVLRQDQTWLVLGRTSSADSTSTGPNFQAGEIVLSPSAATSASGTVTFARPFTSAPVVTVNISTAPGPSAGWGSRAINITTTNFLMFIFSTNATPQTFSSPVQWQAQEYTQ